MSIFIKGNSDFNFSRKRFLMKLDYIKPFCHKKAKSTDWKNEAEKKKGGVKFEES